MALLLIDNQGGVYRSDIATGTVTRLADYSLTFTDIAVAPDGRVFANTTSALYELDLTNGTATQRATLSAANALAFGADGRLYVAGSANSISVLSLSTFQLERSFTLPVGTTSAGDIHVNGNLLYLATSARTILSLDLTTGSVVANVSHGIYNLFGLHSENGRLYGLANNDIYAIDPATGTAVRTLELPLPITIFGAATLAGVTVTGTSGDDVILADQNGSVIDGREGDDILIGSASADRMDGGAGRDHLHGLDGRDTLSGGQDHDVIEGGGGNDRISGGSGRDILSGGRGQDTLTGGTGRDTFIFTARDGTDRITDFDGTEDMLELSASLMGTGPKTVERLEADFATQTVDGLLLDFGAAGRLLLAGADLADLRDNVLFI